MTTGIGSGRSPGQLSLAFPHQAALGEEDFFITPSNERAYELVTSWPDWPKRPLLLVGPPGSGKTHLASIWCGMADARVVAATDLSTENVPELAEAPALLIDDLSVGSFDETALFHLLNMLSEYRRHVLLCATGYPADWGIGLPDLASRLKAMPVAELMPPDEPLLRAVVVKLFADRQIKVEESVVSYLFSRMERSIAAARHLVELIDRKALEQKSPVTRPFVSKLLRDEGIV